MCGMCAGAAPGTYSGVLDAFAKTLRRDGPLAFYNGFSLNFARLGSWNVVRGGVGRAGTKARAAC